MRQREPLPIPLYVYCTKISSVSTREKRSQAEYPIVSLLEKIATNALLGALSTGSTSIP